MRLEEWKPVVGFEGLYEVSNHGRIRSSYRGGKLLNGNVDGRGYNRVWLWKNRVKSKHSLHRLVIIAFIENPNNHPCINHIDGNKLNNALKNLEWCSYQQNTRHAFKNGLMRGSDQPRPWRRKPVQQIGQGHSVVWESISQASKQTGISIPAICNCLSGRVKTAGGFVWRYR